jgi:hypothetical protein
MKPIQNTMKNSKNHTSKADLQRVRELKAYQHFMFYIDIEHLREHNPWESKMLFDHFLIKLRAINHRYNSDCIEVGAVVKWVQEMTTANQLPLIKYIHKYHIDKY